MKRRISISSDEDDDEDGGGGAWKGGDSGAGGGWKGGGIWSCRRCDGGEGFNSCRRCDDSWKGGGEFGWFGNGLFKGGDNGGSSGGNNKVGGGWKGGSSGGGLKGGDTRGWGSNATGDKKIANQGWGSRESGGQGAGSCGECVGKNTEKSGSQGAGSGGECAGKNTKLDTLLEKLIDSVLLMNDKVEGLSNRFNALEEKVNEEIMLGRKERTEFMNEVKSELAKLKKSQEEERTVFVGSHLVSKLSNLQKSVESNLPVDIASSSGGWRPRTSHLDVQPPSGWDKHLNVQQPSQVEGRGWRPWPSDMHVQNLSDCDWKSDDEWDTGYTCDFYGRLISEYGRRKVY